jgi:hypothetical protein
LSPGGHCDAVFCSKVESIEDTRQRNGKTQFRIRWKGYGPDTDTWENEEDLSCPNIIKAFLEKNKGKKRAGKGADSSVSKKTRNETGEGNVEDEEEGESKEYEVSIQYEGRFVGVHFQVFIMFFTTCIPTIYTISSGNIS